MAGRYWLGVDVGTTFTAAAVRRDGRTEVVHLGARGAAIPSVLLLREDGELITGDTARRRAVSEPDRVATEFKRRVGDPVPVLVGGSPFAAETLVARLLRWVVDAVTQREGGPPEGIAVTHPANWGPYKLDLLSNALRTAGVERFTLLSEPAAAARHYAALARVPDGAVVAVYDLGGGTFDACVLRKHTDGSFQLIGQPEGIERLGGIDLDEAVLGHLQRSADDLFVDLDSDDPATRAALNHLRDECTAAKEQLSSDVDAVIHVLLPGQPGRDVRITRGEFESLVRPVLSDTIGCVERSLRTSGVTVEELHAVLLVGGSSRVPLVGQMVATGLGRPVAVDVDPKLSVAQGAALAAEAEFAEPAHAPTEAVPVVAPVPDTPRPAWGPPAGEPLAPAPAPEPPAGEPPVPVPTLGGGDGDRRVVVDGPRNRWPLVAAVLLVLAALVGGYLAISGGDGDGGEDDVSSGDSTTTSTTEAAEESTSTTTSLPEGVDPSLPQFVSFDGVELDGGIYKIFFAVNFDIAPATLQGPENHIHFFWGNENRAQAGTNGDPESCNCWLAFGGVPPVEDPSLFSVAGRPEGATEICALVATPQHAIADVNDDGAPDPGSGTCIDVSSLVADGDSVGLAAGAPAGAGPVVMAAAHPSAACLLPVARTSI